MGRPIHSALYRLNGTHACSLDKLLSKWDICPFTRHFIDQWVCVSVLNNLSIEWAWGWGIIQRMKELAAKNYVEVDLFNWIEQSKS